MTMTENTKLWDILGRTDPAHTKAFSRAGGFKGTALKPMWSYRRMTEEFGPCGKGWGVGKPDFQVVPGPEGEVLVFCTASVWWLETDAASAPMGDNPIHTVYGVGGDKAVGKNKYGLATDDEAFKKAYTDAVTNALKMIGVAADIHMGMFDDSKYVNAMREEFADEAPAQSDPPRKANGLPEKGWRNDGTRTSFALKKEQPDLFPTMSREVDECGTLLSLDKLRESYRKTMEEEKWNREFKATSLEIFLRREGEIRAEMERLEHAEPEELSKLPARTALEHSVNTLRAG
jgi:hypothetical protein